MNRQAFEQQIYENWAEHAGCAAGDLRQPGTTLKPRQKDLGSNGIHIWYLGLHSLVWLDPGREGDVRRVLDGLPPNTALTADHLQAAWGAEAIRAREQDAAFYLFPDDLRALTPPAPITRRGLVPADAGSMARLFEACTPEDVVEASIAADHELGCACFDQDQMVAAASAYTAVGFMDIGVLTHPAYRRRGLGKTVVSPLCQWSISRGFIPQYRCSEENIGSRSVAQGLGFTFYFWEESSYLHPD